MAVRATRIRPAAVRESQADAGADDAALDPREVLRMLEPSGYVDDNIDTARGVINAAIIGIVFWSLTIGAYLILT
jgi:hypothetical protein